MLRYQILVCNEEFVFHVHAAAIKLGSCAECAAHSFVIRLRTTIFTACANGTDEQVFRRVERRTGSSYYDSRDASPSRGSRR